MEVDQAAPHTGANTNPRCHDTALPAPGDLHAFVDEPLRRPPSFNEADVSDKPRFVRMQPRLSSDAISDLRRIQNCRLASLLAVDRGVGRIVNALAEEHQLANTAIFYTSDNGFLLGEHRYDLRSDPSELDNLYPAPSASAETQLQRSLRVEAAELSDCSGIAERDPEPPSGHYCR
jgi:hypothetical protein